MFSILNKGHLCALDTFYLKKKKRFVAVRSNSNLCDWRENEDKWGFCSFEAFPKEASKVGKAVPGGVMDKGVWYEQNIGHMCMEILKN